MTSPIISSAVANRLNGIIQKTLDSRLFLFCNYEPTVPFAVSEEGKFLLAVQDLYKFALDSSCILKNWNKYLPIAFRPYYSRIGEIVDFISEVRSAIDHNQSNENGWLEQYSMDFYKKWIITVIHKETPECEEDYSTLCVALEATADELIIITEKFANHFATRTDKPRVIKEWIADTLKWYTQTSKTDIYRSQMIDAYLARISAKGRVIENWSRRALREQTSRWIYNLYYKAPLIEKDKLINEKMRLEAALSLENTETVIWAKGLPDGEIMRFKEEIRRQIEEKEKEIRKLTDQITNSGISNPDVYFFQHLGDQIRDTMDNLERDGIAYSLLPQSILQEDIERVFSQVPIPEN